MNPERWKKIEEIFHAALDCETSEREAFVRSESGGDEELRLEVEKLIARSEKEETFLESPVWTDSRLLGNTLKKGVAKSIDEEISPAPPAEFFSNRKIGVYRLTEQIGKGGMGVVYAAQREDGEFSQKVAVKLIKRGMDTDFIVQRFRHERQILASLNHPNIARLLDGGTTADGLPYFIMEFIEGAPFFKFCEANNLDLRERLRLFLAVCSAISYAHNKKIIHRDIKPGNILVDEEGTPKLLDFGIAKILDPDLIHESISPTATAMRLMTPEYASPEQARGEEITSASDQYSLGVLLYELLTGNRPYKFSSRAPHEIARVICEEMPSEPSSGDFGKLTGDADLISDKDYCRKLDLIVLKALRKNPAERYASVKEFAADIERFLSGEQVQAESFAGDKEISAARKNVESPANVSQKSIAVLPFKILDTISDAETGDGGFLSIGLADALITRLSNVRQFLVRPTSSILSYAERTADSFAAGAELNVQYILDGSIIKANERIRVSVQLLDVAGQITVWAERFDEDFTDVLSLEDTISARVAESLVPQLTTGERKNLAKRGTDDAGAYEAYLRGRYYWNTFTEDGFRKAISFYQRAVELDPDYALAHSAIADYYVWLGVYGVVPPQKCYPAAKKAALRAIELDDKLAEAYGALGLARLYGEYDWQQSETEILRAIELNPNNAVVHLWYSHNLYTQGQFEKGFPHVKRAVELDPLAFLNHNTLAWSYYFSRRFDEALLKIDDVIERFPAISHSYFSKACFLNYVGRPDEAMMEMNRALKLSDDSLFTLYGLAQTLGAAGRRREAVELIEKTEAESETKYFSYFQVALVYCYLKDKDKAFEYLELAYENRESLLVWVGIEPSLDAVRDDARYISFLKKINHPTLKTIYKKAAEQQTLIEEFKGKSVSAAAGQKSIAVLPFKNLNSLSGEDTGGGEFLSIGLADALITRLSNVRQFIVRPTSSVLRFTAGDADSFAAGEELKVGFIVEGNILRADGRIRVSVQLLDVAAESTVWAERFDEDFTDVLSLEDSISMRVAESLVPQLSTNEAQNLAKRATENAEAYEAYLRGRFHWNTFTEDGFRQAKFYYRKAIELDPNYALAFAGLADYYMWLGVYGVVSPKECYPPAKESARRAIEIDDDLAEAYSALGFAQLCGDFDWREAEKNAVYALRLNPNYAVGHLWYSYVLLSDGRFDEGIEHTKRAVELDPLTYNNQHTIAWGCYFARRYEEALKQADENIKNFPTIGLAYFTRSWILRRIGKTAEAVENSKKAMQLSGESLFVLLGHAQALASDGRRKATEEILRKIEAESERQYLSYYQVALVYAYLKDKGKTLDALERAFSDNEGWLIWLAIEPSFDFLRDDARYKSLLAKIKQSPAQAEKVSDTSNRDESTVIKIESENRQSRRQFLHVPLLYALIIAAIIAAIVLYFALIRSS